MYQNVDSTSEAVQNQIPQFGENRTESWHQPQIDNQHYQQNVNQPWQTEQQTEHQTVNAEDQLQNGKFLLRWSIVTDL